MADEEHQTVPSEIKAEELPGLIAAAFEVAKARSLVALFELGAILAALAHY